MAKLTTEEWLVEIRSLSAALGSAQSVLRGIADNILPRIADIKSDISTLESEIDKGVALVQQLNALSERSNTIEGILLEQLENGNN